MKREIPPLRFDTSDAGLHKAFRTACQRYLTQQEDHRFADAGMVVKLLVLTLGCAAFYALTLMQYSVWRYALCYFGYLFFAMLLVVNVLHDASHNAFFRRAWANRWLGRVVSIPLGLDADSWQVRHVQFHHPYTNIQHYDPDIDENGVLRQTPYQRWKPFMRFQRYYWPLVAALTFPWYAWWMDWCDRAGATAFSSYLPLRGMRGWGVFLAAKGLHGLLALGVPMWWMAGDISIVTVLLVYLLSQMVVSALFVSLLIGTHWAKGHFYAQPEEPTMPHSHYHHAFATTFDWGTRHRRLGYWLGGLNLHLTHHLFPNWSHRHFTALSAIITDVTRKAGIDYQPLSLRDLLKLQRQHLERLGRKPPPQRER